MIETFDLHQEQLSLSYQEIYGILRKERLLSAEKSSNFSSKAIESFVQERTLNFVNEMKIGRESEIFEACDRVVLVFAKVVLSIFRRGKELYTFHAEGRVQASS